MKKSLFPLFLVILAISIFFITSCKKSDVTDDPAITDEQVTTQSEDQARFTAEDDALTDELNVLLESEPTLRGRGNGTMCGATVVINASTNPRTATITFNGDTCNNRTRTGVITLSLSGRWENAGSQLSVTYNNVKIKRLVDNKSITINGSKTITNESGHLLIYLLSNPSANIVHRLKSTGMSITFDNGTARTWEMETKRVFTNNGGLVITAYGTHNDGTNSDVAYWGTNRLGQSFSTRVVNPIVVKQNCNFRVTSGKVMHTKMAKDITATFGLDATGTPIAACGGPLYMKLEWLGVNGASRSLLVRYY